MTHDLQWYAYLHTTHGIRLFRLHDVEAIKDCRKSPFCVRCTNSFKAITREDAMKKAINIIGQPAEKLPLKKTR